MSEQYLRFSQRSGPDTTHRSNHYFRQPLVASFILRLAQSSKHQVWLGQSPPSLCQLDAEPSPRLGSPADRSEPPLADQRQTRRPLTIAQRTGAGLTTTALGAGLTTTAPGTGRRATTAPLGPAHPALTTPRAQTTAFASTGTAISAKPSMPEAKIRVLMTLPLLMTDFPSTQARPQRSRALVDGYRRYFTFTSAILPLNRHSPSGLPLDFKIA